jgi:phage N-6-adenine-methyltransferase
MRLRRLPVEGPYDMTASHRLIHQSKRTDWWTPPRYLEAARTVLGGFDLDPASCAEANEAVQAARYFSPPEDGLTLPWSGRVWLNPPYGKHGGKSRQALWSLKLSEEYQAGRVSEAILLVNAQTGDAWFGPLWDKPICFVRRRIKFLLPGGAKPKQPTHSNAFVYFGARPARFEEVFGEFGRVVLP